MRSFPVVGQTSNRLLDPTALLPSMLNADCLIHGVLQCVCCSGWMYVLCSLSSLSLSHVISFLRLELSTFDSVEVRLTPPSWTMVKREQIRARFTIPGSPLEDCCVSFWCQVRLD